MADNEKSTFIKIDKFDAAVAALALIRKKLMDANNTLDKINTLKQEEDITIQKWASDMQTIQSRIDAIETELLKEEQ
jgi:hypothetical protein